MLTPMWSERQDTYEYTIPTKQIRTPTAPSSASRSPTPGPALRRGRQHDLGPQARHHGRRPDPPVAGYDAWNRLVKVYDDTDDDGFFEPSGDDSGGHLATYAYDGLHPMEALDNAKASADYHGDEIIDDSLKDYQELLKKGRGLGC